LRAQTLPSSRWETLIVDNASSPACDLAALRPHAPDNARLVVEPTLGLSAARRRGFCETTAPVIVYVDDDNVLAPDYLAQVLAIFAAYPPVGLAGGKSVPEFESPPPAWTREFFPLLALRDLGNGPLVAKPSAAGPLRYPVYAPIGAGLAARRAALQPWIDRPASLSDRRGAALTSAGDNDIVLCAFRAGWSVGYFPELVLTHLIPDARLTTGYLARLNRGIQSSWMQVLLLHGAGSWPPIARWTLPLRCAKAWWTHRAWRGPVERIRWAGARGHFEGRAT
jgi:glycosyltransferase involved in cell wall biosynthesis